MPQKFGFPLKDIISDLKKSDTWKIQLTITSKFISSKDDNDEEHEIHSKGDNIVIIMNDEADEFIKAFSIMQKKISK